MNSGMELRQRLAQGDTVYGMMLSEIYVPNVARLIAGCGYEFMIVDCEHGYFDRTQVADIAAVADGVGLPIIVRVAAPDRSAITQYMDLGARGILLSNTAGVEQARALVDLCRYAPEGNRGVSTFRAHTGYNSGDVIGIMRSANERNLVICQIESEQAAAAACEILRVDGVDGALIGPNDMSQQMGIFGQYEHPRMLRALEQVAEGARQNGKWAGIITTNAQLLGRCKQLNMRCFSAGSELNFLASGAKSALERTRKL